MKGEEGPVEASSFNNREVGFSGFAARIKLAIACDHGGKVKGLDRAAAPFIMRLKNKTSNHLRRLFSVCWNGMMFVQDCPLPTDLSEADGQSKFELSSFPAFLDVLAAHSGSNKRNVIPCRNLHLNNVKNS